MKAQVYAGKYGLKRTRFLDYETGEVLDQSLKPHLIRDLLDEGQVWYPLGISVKTFPDDIDVATIHTINIENIELIHNRLGPAIVFLNGKKIWALNGLIMKPYAIFDRLSAEEKAQVVWSIDEWI